MIAPLGLPVVPEVYEIMQSSNSGGTSGRSMVLTRMRSANEASPSAGASTHRRNEGNGPAFDSSTRVSSSSTSALGVASPRI